MFQQSHGLCLHESNHHITEDGADRIESFICRTNIAQTCIVEQNLLYNEDGNRLTKFAARLHDAKTKRDDLGRQEEVDHFGAVVLDKSTDHAE